MMAKYWCDSTVYADTPTRRAPGTSWSPFGVLWPKIFARCALNVLAISGPRWPGQPGAELRSWQAACSVAPGHGNPQHDTGTLSQRTFDASASPMQVDDRFDQGEAQAGPLRKPRAGLSDAIEAIE
jgi:hypothetical protein